MLLARGFIQRARGASAPWAAKTTKWTVASGRSAGRRAAHNSVQAALRAIGAVDPQVNAVVHTLSEEELVEALEAAGGTGLLEGMPILVKDSIAVRGMPLVVGDPTRVSLPLQSDDAPLIARLRAAGAVVVGKTNVPNGSLDLQTFNEVFGRTSNPYDVSRTPGGSSGGSAAAVAAGMVPLAIGSDLGGSLRVPTAFCGVTSMKPTARRIPTVGHVPPARLDQGMLTLGAIAQNVSLLETFMQVACSPPQPACGDASQEISGTSQERSGMQGLASHDLGLAPLPFFPGVPPQAHEISVLLSPSLPGAPTQRAVSQAIERFGDQLAAAGVKVQLGAPALQDRELFQAYKVFAELCSSSVLAPEAVIDPSKRIEGDASPTASQLVRAEQIRDAARLAIAHALHAPEGETRVWVLPACGVLAYPHNEDHSRIDVDGQMVSYWRALISYAYQAAVCGNPVVTLPIAMHGHLPVGVQVIGGLWQDARLLAACKTMEQILERPVPPPPLHAAFF
ncbi:amidase signature domain-containing protein [Baffinella frigidus]|nr:amidase signature domain-containing protein [Cryptophyta sp. CCMP2293]|mmetsp:Transcript_50551/g.120313  ORF Transcript_50551/g.120313 Transcript_50551/m.120313 type:complete len:508 (+) Transcript_50551:293-1816(+)